jgi:hypothetical protein
MRLKILIALAIAAHCCVIGSASGQVVFGQPPSADARFVFQSWTIENDITGDKRDLSQWYFPVYGFVPVAEHWEVHISSASAGTQTDSAGNDVSITGLNDTRIAVLRSLMDNRLLVGFGLNLPTGKSTLDREQSGLGQLLTSDFLNLPSKIYGEGLGVYLESAYSRQLERLTLGIGAGYLINSSYSPEEEVDDYNPGNRFTIAGTALYSYGLGTAYLFLRHNAYAASTQGDREVYKVGGITEFALGTALDYEQFEIEAGMRMLFRGTDSRLESGELAEYEQNNYGSDLRFFSSLGYNLEGIGTPVLLIDYKRVGANGFDVADDEHVGKANLFGIGVGFERSVTEQVDLSGNLKTLTGSAEDGNLDLSGFEIALAAGVVF